METEENPIYLNLILLYRRYFFLSWTAGVLELYPEGWEVGPDLRSPEIHCFVRACEAWEEHCIH